jgi:hypothetical protein
MSNELKRKISDIVECDDDYSSIINEILEEIKSIIHYNSEYSVIFSSDIYQFIRSKYNGFVCLKIVDQFRDLFALYVDFIGYDYFGIE